MIENGRKSLEMDGKLWNVFKCLQWLKMAEYGLKWLNMAEHGWKLQKLLEMAGNSCIDKCHP